jgi:hypothetical protein
MGFSQNSLTSCIYDMALGRSSWDNILDILSATFPGCLITVSGDDLSTGANLAFAQRGLSPAAAASYISTYSALNQALNLAGDLAVFQVFHDDALVDRNEAAQGRFNLEWLSRQGDFTASTGVVVLREGARQLALQVYYSPQRQGELRPRVAAVRGESAPQIGRANEIAGRTPVAHIHR